MIKKDITDFDKKKQKLENKIVDLENEISNLNSTKLYKSGMHDNIMRIKQAGNLKN